MFETKTILRQDFDLRAKYSELHTIIYRIADHEYQIYTDIDNQQLEKISKDFDHSIRYITSLIKVVNVKPAKFIEILPGIQDKDIPLIEDCYAITAHDILRKLSIKFPAISFQRIETGSEYTVYVASYSEVDGNIKRFYFLPLSDRKRVEEYIISMELPVKVNLKEIEESPSLSQANQSLNPVMEIVSSRFTDKRVRGLVERDETLYFENVKSIFEGSFSKTDLYYYNNNEYSCYVDFSTSQNINVRSLLPLYSQIFIVMPFQTSGADFLNGQKLKREDFYHLIKRNRVKILLPQPEARYDLNFLTEIQNIAPDAIITRRALAILQQIDIVEMADNFIFNNDELRKEIKPLCEAINEKNPHMGDLLYSLFHWPLSAKRKSFYALQTAGIHGVSTFGINNALEKEFSRINKRDLSFDFMVNAMNIHFAHALNATYFPTVLTGGYSDYSYAHVMGIFLNLIRGTTQKTLVSQQNFDKNVVAGILPIEYLNTFEVETYIPVKYVEKTLSSPWTFYHSHGLLAELDKLSFDERNAKVKWYNKKVEERLRTFQVARKLLDLGSGFGLDILGSKLKVDYLGSMVNVVNSAVGPSLGNSIKRIAQRLNDALYSADQQQIHFLSRINRVARLSERET